MIKKALLLIFIMVLTGNVVASSPKSTVLIFLSFSMNDESIQGWMREASKINAPVIIRGLVDNSFKATVAKIASLKIKTGLQVDPILFKKFDINQVPAVVVVDTAKCLPMQSCQQVFDVIYGNVHLSYALKKIVEQNDDLSPIANDALKNLEQAR